jgi:crotonobetainyl-CoA:carnitine CoA-transferase CaiB-like acyl-CoA transferase
MSREDSPAKAMLAEIWAGLGGDPALLPKAEITGEGDLPSVFAVTDLASAAIAAAGLAAAELIATRHGAAPAVTVDRRLASHWFAWTLQPEGWSVPPPWDPIAGDYPTRDGWIRLHTNAPHHRAAALAVLGVPAEKEKVAAAVAGWAAEELETAVVARGGCAAVMRGAADWAAHAQGRAVAAEPLFHHAAMGEGAPVRWPVSRERPLAGLKVLDLTRVLAGPVATRCLAGLGADVLRIDPPDWDEPSVVPEVTLGKRCARLDLREPGQRAAFERLLAEADILVHGYRSDALARLGLDAEARHRIRPGLIDVALDAYGWTGPWAQRRGFDSLVQMSAGIADAGMRRLGRECPTPLPVQALDHALGYMMAAAALRGVTARLATGRGSLTHSSLARVAALLVNHPADLAGASVTPPTPEDYADAIEQTAWGPARRMKPPVTLAGAALSWDRPAGPLGAAEAGW